MLQFRMETQHSSSPTAPTTPLLPTPPRWDVSVIYPGLDSPEFADGFAAAVKAIHDLKDRFDRGGRRSSDGKRIARRDRVTDGVRVCD